jgi:two-component system secretion system response regulator SalR
MPSPRNGPLTRQEKLVIQHICAGQSAEEAAAKFFVLKRTIDFHLVNVYRKWQIENRIQLYIRAVELGIVEPPAKVQE